MFERLHVVWTDRAEKDARRLPPEIRKRVAETVDRYAETGHGDVLRLKGFEPPRYRLRVGDYRAIFRPQGSVLVILRVRHRRDAY